MDELLGISLQSCLVHPKSDLLPNGDISHIKVFLKGENNVQTSQEDPIPNVPTTHPCSSIISCSSMHFSSTRRLRSWSRISR